MSFVLLLCALCPAQVQDAGNPCTESLAPWQKRFESPPAESRILPIQHGLPLSREQQDAYLDYLANCGFGGMVTNVCFNDYLQNEEYWQAFVRGIQEAKKRGFVLWLYDEHGYPSGTAAGLTLQDHPEWEARGLLIVQTRTRGGMLELNCPPCKLVFATAYPMSDGAFVMENPVDLTQFINEGIVRWEAPPGDWHVFVVSESTLYKGTHAQLSLCDKLPYINLLMPEPTARFLQITHDAYASRLGIDLGKWFVSTFTDEPSLMSLFLEPQPWSVIPWAPNLPEVFEKRCGYKLEPVLPLILAGKGAREKKARVDFWQTVAQLVSENYFGQIQSWCKNHNLRSGGHLLLEEPILTHVPLYGNFFQCIRRLDAPSMDCLHSIPEEVPWQTARLISSVADLENRDVTMCETSDFAQQYRAEGDTRPKYQVSEFEIRGTCNRLLVNGITIITSYYNWQPFPPETIQRINSWVGRCSTAMKNTKQFSDVAVLYPAESMMAHFTPSTQWTREASPSAQIIQKVYDNLSHTLFHSGWDFTYIDGQVLEEATVDKGALCKESFAWRIIVLPAVDTLSTRAWEKLFAFWQSGGVILALAKLPENTLEDFPSPTVQNMANTIFLQDEPTRFSANANGGYGVYLPLGQESYLKHILNQLIERDVRFPENAPLRATHRRGEDGDIYFIINDSPEPWEGEISFHFKESGEQWNPADGSQATLTDPTCVHVCFEPYGGAIFRFKKVPLTKRLERKTIALLPEKSLKRLPETTPTLSKGENATNAQLVSSSAGVYTAKITIKETGKDTFAFQSFSYPGNIDLSQATTLVLHVEIPSEQPCNQTLLVIIKNKTGSEYFADTGIPLSLPGKYVALVDLRNLRPVPWKSIPQTPIKLEEISEILVGWGGYLGKEQEEVEFSVSTPSVHQ
ncbi:MAG TPA: glycosyl hydrolase [Candidatus Hydrogenedentes bacterium]|nr:glycosyl hydrolase [Candidatus Hydrogenedentota bacterium]HOL76483.1 glycosyl hydrolase [Candidatus Hydrogenedentota bacterium]HPO85147.1 glycosyl hydrolase [Candidatus Hydrogenedentota bacterium]